MAHGLSIAALSPQWIGIAAASAIVVVLIVILLVRRSRAGKADAPAPHVPTALTEMPVPQPAATPDAPPPAAPAGAPPSFLDQPLQGGFEGLGRPAGTQPTLGTVVMPREPKTLADPSADPLAPRSEPPVMPPMDMGMDMGSLSPAGPEETAPVVEADAPHDATPGATVAEGAIGAPALEAPAPDAPSSAAPAADAEAAAAPLSDIIVTTNKAEVDLTDPDVRAMLEELVRDEIALAEVYRSQGQTLDAILQLTEAEKACNALGDEEQSRRIKAMLAELQP